MNGRFCGAVILTLALLSAASACTVPSRPPQSARAPQAEVLDTIRRAAYYRPLPSRLRAYAALSVKLPRHKDAFFEGALWLARPETATFAAVDDFGNPLFYLRYTKKDGWLLQYGETVEEKVALPVDGRTFVALVFGMPPPLPRDVVQIPAFAPTPIVLSGEGSEWRFDAAGRPLSYATVKAPRVSAYRFEWLAWCESGGFRIPTRMRLQNPKKGVELEITLYDPDVVK